jgi:segregation and condensation protein B
MGEKYDENMAKIEAILYAIGRPISLTDICAHLELESELEALQLIDKITKIYQQEESALEIKRLPRDRVVLQLNPDFTKKVRRISNKPLLTDGPLKTLSYVAYNQPIDQKDVAKARGSHSYKHLTLLDEMGLISREKKGRNRLIRTTSDFADYLGLSYDRTTMKRQLTRIFKRLVVEEL